MEKRPLLPAKAESNGDRYYWNLRYKVRKERQDSWLNAATKTKDKIS